MRVPSLQRTTSRVSTLPSGDSCAGLETADPAASVRMKKVPWSIAVLLNGWGRETPNITRDPGAECDLYRPVDLRRSRPPGADAAGQAGREAFLPDRPGPRGNREPNALGEEVLKEDVSDNGLQVRPLMLRCCPLSPTFLA